jgi:hypothetical protein
VIEKTGKKRLIDKIDEKLERMDSPLDPRIVEGRKVGGPEYDAFFKKMLKKWKIKSYKDLPKNKQSKFFDEVDKGWNAKKETD